ARDFRQAVGAGEGGQGDLGDLAHDAVVEDGGDEAGLVDLHLGQIPEGGAVRIGGLDDGGAVVLCQAAGGGVQVEGDDLFGDTEVWVPRADRRAAARGERAVRARQADAGGGGIVEQAGPGRPALHGGHVQAAILGEGDAAGFQ